MAFPKKYTRHIRVGTTEYVWHLNRNSLYLDEPHITIQHAAVAGQILFLDPFPHDLEIRPKTIRDAIIHAHTLGWHPEKSGEPLYLGWKNAAFFLLPKGVQFTHQLIEHGEQHDERRA